MQARVSMCLDCNQLRESNLGKEIASKRLEADGFGLRMSKWTKIVALVALIAVVAVCFSPAAVPQNCTTRSRHAAARVLHAMLPSAVLWVMHFTWDSARELEPSHAPADLLQMVCVRLC